MIKSTTQTVTEFVRRHKIAIAITGTAAVTAAACLAMNQEAIKQHNEFLKEKGLFDEFYFMSDDPEDM